MIHAIQLALFGLSAGAGSVDDEPPTFHGDVAPLLRQHCVRCHRPGALAPMSLLEPAEVRGWAPMIDEVVHEGRMPPWFADPEVGDFANEARLDDDEKSILRRWVAAGAPLGTAPSPADSTPQDDSEWEIGAPDIEVELPRVEHIPATGVVSYSYHVLDPKLEEDRWIEAVEVRPTDLERTHHVVVYVLAPGENPEQGFTMRRLMGRRLSEYVPGRGATSIPAGHGCFLAKGSKLFVQVHYQPNGVPGEDRTRIGLRFARGPVEREVRSLVIFNLEIRLEPNLAGQSFSAIQPIETDGSILSLYPRMHTRGAAFSYELLRADGSSRPLLRIPRYDYNWQLDYELAEPVPIRRGDRIRIEATYDNSADNPFNPAPDAIVTWGEHLFDEMMVGFVRYSVPRATEGG